MINNKVKVNKPNKYNGDQNKLNKKLIRIEINLKFNAIKFKYKILFMLIFFIN